MRPSFQFIVGVFILALALGSFWLLAVGLISGESRLPHPRGGDVIVFRTKAPRAFVGVVSVYGLLGVGFSIIGGKNLMEARRNIKNPN